MRRRNAIVGKCADCGRPILPDQPHSRFAVLNESGRPVPGRFLMVHIECPEPIRHASVAS